MLSADISILYVTNVLKSVDFYSALFDMQPVEKSPTFALFVFDNGFKLGLWSRFTAEPLPSAGCSGETVFSVATKAEVDTTYHHWCNHHRVTIIQKTCQLDFGYSFAAVDLDGHRLRVCYLEEE